jgi:hypothetical protein
LTALIYAVKDVEVIVPEQNAEPNTPRDMTLHIQAFQELLKTARGILGDMQSRKAEIRNRKELLKVEDISPRVKSVLKDIFSK